MDQHFHARVSRAGPNDCWPYIGSRDKKGYGKLKRKGRAYKAHRFAAMQEGLDISGQCVLHRCDNPPCCNPNHLFLGSHKDNSDDKIAKGRARYAPQDGANNGNSKLSPLQIEQILEDPRNNVQVAKDYGVTHQTIHLVRKGKSWQSLPRKVEQSGSSSVS